MHFDRVIARFNPDSSVESVPMRLRYRCSCLYNNNYLPFVFFYYKSKTSQASSV